MLYEYTVFPFLIVGLARDSITSHTSGMTDYLRTISVSVDESDPGSFFWVLMESTEDATIFIDLASAEAPEDTWVAALDAGVATLKALAPNPSIGPRGEVEDEDSDPVG